MVYRERRSVKVMMMVMMTVMMVRYEGWEGLPGLTKKGAATATNPQSSWCV